MRRVLRLIVSLSWVLLAGCGAAPKHHHVNFQVASVPIPKDSAFILEPLESGHLNFRGIVDRSVDDQNHVMMYPGDAGVAGFLVGIATHAAVEAGMQSSKASAAQNAADKVLLPIQRSIDQLNYDELVSEISESNPRLLVSHILEEPVMSLNQQPVFFVSRDYSTITLKNIISINTKDQKANPVYQNMIEVVYSLPEGFIDKAEPEKSHVLQSAALELLSESLRLGIDDASLILPQNEKMQTYRYLDADKYRYERASLVEQDCSRIVLRTLRKWLKSRPSALFLDLAPKAEENCEKPTQAIKSSKDQFANSST